MDGGGGGQLEGYSASCFAFLARARAQHLRCKILNPGASAISPTSSKETVEEEEEEEADGNGTRIGVQDVRRGGGGREGVRC